MRNSRALVYSSVFIVGWTIMLYGCGALQVVISSQTEEECRHIAIEWEAKMRDAEARAATAATSERSLEAKRDVRFLQSEKDRILQKCDPGVFNQK